MKRGAAEGRACGSLKGEHVSELVDAYRSRVTCCILLVGMIHTAGCMHAGTIQSDGQDVPHCWGGLRTGRREPFRASAEPLADTSPRGPSSPEDRGAAEFQPFNLYTYRFISRLIPPTHLLHRSRLILDPFYP
jgi:hypothetical protein